MQVNFISSKEQEAYHQGEGAVEEVQVVAVDNLTLEVTLTEPMPQFLELTGRLLELYPIPIQIVFSTSRVGSKCWRIIYQ